MALKTWLPLDGSLRNLGLDTEISYEKSEVAWSTNQAKFQKSLYIKDSNLIAVVPSLADTNVFSVCFFVYCNRNEDATNWASALEIGDSGNGIRFESSYDGDYTGSIWINNNPGYATLSNNKLITNKFDEWKHIAITCDGEIVREYCDGSLVSTISCTGATINGRFIIPAQGYDGYMNDFRIYDEALSEKDVYEISKGLVLHYPLDNIYESNTENLLQSDKLSCDGYYWRNENGTSSIDDDGVFHTSINFTGTGGSAWGMLNSSKFDFTAGKRYVYSCKIRVNSATNNFSFQIRAAWFSNHWETDSIWVNPYGLAQNGGWRQFNIATTIQSSFIRPSSGTVITDLSPRLEIWTDNMNVDGEVYSAEIDIKDICVYELDSGLQVSFKENGSTVENIKNITGYGGELYHNPIYFDIDETPIGKGSLNFAETSYVHSDSITPMFGAGQIIQSMSMSCWIKSDDFDSNYNNQPTLIGIGGNSCMRLRMSYSGQTIILTSLVSMYNKTANCMVIATRSFTNTPTLVDNKWHHIVVTFDKGIISLFVDGNFVEKTDVSDINSTIKVADTNTIISIGSLSEEREQFVGNICDVRVYNTALDETYIKELYSTRYSVTDTGKLYCNNIDEENYLMTCSSNGVIKCATLNEGCENFGFVTDKTINVKEIIET